MIERNYYAILGVAGDADPEVIDAAYRALMKKYHPDRCGGLSEERAKDINRAYAVLRDRAKRASYDRELADDQARRQPLHRPVPPAQAPPSPPSPSTSAAQQAPTEEPPSNKRYDGPCCPRCQRFSPRTARFCDYCGFDFHQIGEPPLSPPPPLDRPKSKVFALVCVGVIIAAAIGLMLGVTARPETNGPASNLAHPRTETGGERANPITYPLEASRPNSDRDCPPEVYWSGRNHEGLCFIWRRARANEAAEAANAPPRVTQENPSARPADDDPCLFEDDGRPNGHGRCVRESEAYGPPRACPAGPFDEEGRFIDEHGQSWVRDNLTGQCFLPPSEQAPGRRTRQNPEGIGTYPYLPQPSRRSHR
jgi:hypothetical protein